MFESLQLVGLSTILVTAAEIGDKTQLLALCLAARFRKPLPICLAIFASTVANHTLAGLLGASVASFFAMAAWMLVPDKIDDDDDQLKYGNFGVFGTTFILFFLAEMGDKTQLATVALGASYADSVLAVVTGTTLGMLIADVPAVFIGNKLSEKLSMSLMRKIAAGLFVIFAVLAYFA